MEQKLTRIVVIVAMVLVAYVGIFVYAGKEWFSYVSGAVSLEEKNNADFEVNEYIYLSADNLQAFFYGVQENNAEDIFVIVEWSGDYLVLDLDAKKYSDLILRWAEENFDYDTQSTRFKLVDLRGTLLEMDEELEIFILETQGIYLGGDLETKLLSFVFVEGQVGAFTYQELGIITGVIIGVALIGAMSIVLSVLISAKKKEKILVGEEQELE